MKKCTKIILLTAISIIALLSIYNRSFVQIANAEEKIDKIRVGFFDFEGFHEVNDNGEYSGYGYEYLQEIAKYAGWKYEYVQGTWDECLKMLENGEIDLLGSAQYTEERNQVYDYAKLSAGTSYAVLCSSVNNTSLAYEDFGAFEGMRVGILSGNSRNEGLQEYCDAHGFTVQTKLYENQEQLTAALHSGQVDTILTSNLRKANNERVVGRFDPSPFYYITTKGNSKVMDKLNSVMEQIKIVNPDFEGNLYEKYYGIKEADQPVFTKAEKEYIQNKKVIKVSYNTEWGSLERRSKNTNNMAGIVSDIFEQMQLDTDLTFEYYPVESISKAVEMLKNGEIDAISAMQKDSERISQEGYVLTSSYLTSFPMKIVDPGQAVQDDSIAAVTPDFIDLYKKDIIEDVTWKEYNTMEECFAALTEGEVTEIYGDSYITDHFRAQAEYSRLHSTALANQKAEFCMAVLDNTDKRLISILNQSILYLSEQEIQHAVTKNTQLTRGMTIKDYIYQKPLEVILIITGFLFIIIVCLVYAAVIRHKNNKKMYQLLYIDQLTGIWNFNYFMAKLRQILLTEEKSTYALVYMDIERFKDINNADGYEQGNIILKSISQILRENAQTDEIYARVANDNFIALIKYMDIDSFSERLKAYLYKFNQISKSEHENYKLQVTSGIYVIKSDDKEASHVIDCANDARKTIKGARKSAYAFYSDQLQKEMIIQREIESEMEDALRKGQFMAFYQPKADLHTEEYVGAEALVRWRHPERGLIPPFHFIPLFEKNGFVVNIDFFIFEEVCKMIKRQLEEGKTPVPISSNFSRLHFSHQDFIPRLKSIVKQYEVPTELLELEITENMVNENMGELFSILNELRMEGFRIAMDDFGSGYSSLNLLKDLPVDTLKMDKEFLHKGFVSKKDRIIIEGFVDIAVKLKMNVVCEGVETEEQAAFLRTIGCDMAQGYLYAKPMPQAEFESKLYSR